jgi:uncharacterized protein
MSNKNLCPLCKKPAFPAFKPFCSQGCRDRDLLNWLRDSYAVPVKDDEIGNED